MVGLLTSAPVLAGEFTWLFTRPTMVTAAMTPPTIMLPTEAKIFSTVDLALLKVIAATVSPRTANS